MKTRKIILMKIGYYLTSRFEWVSLLLRTCKVMIPNFCPDMDYHDRSISWAC